MRLRRQALMRARMAYEGVMADACRILAYSDALDETGQAVPAYSDAGETACLYSPLSSAERQHATATASEVVARLRLPLGVAITRRDRVRITRRFGITESAPHEYAVEGEPVETLAFLSCDLREVGL